MTQDEQKRLRRHYLSIRGQQRAIDHDKDGVTLESATAKLVEDAVARLRLEFPEMVLPFDFRSAKFNDSVFKLQPIRTYLATILGMIEAEMTADEGPVTETRSFTFLREPKLREIVERDYGEIQRAFISQCWKSTIVLAGGAIEAILADLLLANEPSAKAAAATPKKADITKWDLADLIEVAIELQLVSGGVSKLSHSVREYRNLIHPGNEVRTGLVFDREEAQIALEVLNMLHRDLSL